MFAMIALSIVVTQSLRADEADVPRFNRDIRPILSDRCFPCHGHDAGNRKAELRLDTLEGATEWAVVPGDAENSEVILRVSSDDPEYRMPPANSHRPPLTPQQVELLRRWIAAGAEYEPHWSYIRPEKPAPPEMKGAAPAHNAIDNFLVAKQAQHNIAPAAEADRVTLARRLYFDLTGLPPTPAEIDEFLHDKRPDAYEQLVDKLLASPAYGERMASWWFDLVRFADTVGYHGDQDHRIAPYRDYVIKSFNDDLPFDQFTIEQLAGDLLENPTMWQRVATGYNRVLQTTHEGGAQDGEYLAKHLADRVRNFSEVWLAASMGCAECHDHKFDPITQRDFYSLGAFFADVDHYGSFEKAASNSVPTERPPEMLAWTLPVYEQVQALDKKVAELEAALGEHFKADWEKKRDELIALKRERLELEHQFVPTMITEATTPRDVRILPRGNWMDQSGEVVQPQVPHFFEPLAVGDRRPTRLDLARWLVDGKNPLTARVVVNRLWHRYFGIGLSKGLLDLGSQGEWPQHPDLLDWLAVEFVESGWDMKHMVRLMVTSSAYRQSSRPRPEVEAIDPDNRLVARQSRFRLDAEQIRDNALAVSGLLVRKIGGEFVRPYQPAKYYMHLNFPERDYFPSTDENQFRRALYVHWQRQYLHPWLLAFDAPTREECTAQRNISNTPSAALVLLNDPSFVEAARALASRVLTEANGDDQARLRWAWRVVLGRDARSEEIELLGNLLTSHRAYFASDAAGAEALTSVGISKRPENLPVAEWAAWTSVSRALLNLNETISRY
ncbi:MAG TPA: PSD1 and planctomycete cytochrome C domain-containing protein [Lacipirellulaceae bacterium]|nr:PSD1 and planctomycete cytochrome C domain-containing protein [Lacipirellulaceae bacterium]